MKFKKVDEKSETIKEIKYSKACSDILTVKENIINEKRIKSKK